MDESEIPLVDDRYSQIEDQITEADRLLLCLDFDGTLTPIVDDPSEPEVTEGNRDAIDTLKRQQPVDISIISGRELSDLKARVNIDGISYAGNHGLEMDYGDGPSTHPVASTYRPTIQDVYDALSERFSDDPDCTVENKGITVTFHYRTADADRVDSITDTVVSIAESVGDDRIQLTSGKSIIEIRPSFDWDKGNAVSEFETRCQGDCLVIYIGDDTTDEDAFREIEPDGIGILVGDDPETAAAYRVPDTAGVEAFLRWLADTGTEPLGDNAHERDR